MFLRPFTAVCEIKQASLSLRRPHKQEQRAGSGWEPFTFRFLQSISFFIFFSFWEEACFPASSLFLF
ncbi:hypothetical protein DWY99_08810 [[Clostridium] leptum]|uniref:Uncharacterized protein n=1 Tax=[Clostridium] leptum TaxID=1535 RepID=A0A412AWG5_9FIRM|nr:hypothetical protein DWY99_08810 [[Clostridium] leptum]